MLRKKKGQLFVQAILYLLITAIIMVLLLEAGIPVLEKTRDRSIYERQKDQFLNLNQHIKDVASEGQGSKRIIPIQVEKGSMEVKGNSLIWDMKTDARIIEPRSYVQYGDLSIVSDFDVTATVYNESYVIENSYIRLNMTRCEEANNCSAMSTLINSLSLNGGAATTGEFTFELDNSTFNGTGSTHLLREGTNLESATVVVDLALNDYDLYFTLRSKEDFVIIETVRS